MKKRNLWKLNNSGSSLVTVVVVVTFLTIITTTLLYVAGMNFQMKATDQATKECFYEAETGLEEMKTSIAEMVAECATKTRSQVMSRYAGISGSARELLFQSNFCNAMMDEWNNRATVPGAAPDYEAALKSLVGTAYKSSVFVTAAGQGKMEVVSGELFIRGVQYIYTDSDGYTTIITTDFRILPPEYGYESDVSIITPIPGETVDTTKKKVEVSEYVVYTNWIKQ